MTAAMLWVAGHPCLSLFRHVFHLPVTFPRVHSRTGIRFMRSTRRPTPPSTESSNPMKADNAHQQKTKAALKTCSENTHLATVCFRDGAEGGLNVLKVSCLGIHKGEHVDLHRTAENLRRTVLAELHDLWHGHALHKRARRLRRHLRLRVIRRAVHREGTEMRKWIPLPNRSLPRPKLAEHTRAQGLEVTAAPCPTESWGKPMGGQRHPVVFVHRTVTTRSLRSSSNFLKMTIEFSAASGMRST